MGGGYVRLSQTVAAVIVALRWASYSLTHVLISDPSLSTNVTNHISFPNRSHITGSDITIHQTPLSVPYGAEKEHK
jgi:hypothetical protein